ncbi:MAG: hypothetical protein AABX03_00425 [Nanoarchaeota archaeon]
MALDVSGLSYFMSIFGFLFVFLVMYAILVKTNILGESPFINSFVSFVFAIIFVVFSPAVKYVQTIVPWVAILVICLFFVLVIVGFSQKDMSSFMKPGLAWVFIILLAIIFLVSAIVVFNPFLKPYLPGSSGGGDPFLLSIKNFAYSDKVLGAVLLLIIAALTSWFITKKAK